MGDRYLRTLFVLNSDFKTLSVDELDVVETDVEASIKEAIKEAIRLAETFSCTKLPAACGQFAQ